MSLYGALSSGVSGVNAFAKEMAIRADNVANVATIGYKKGNATFSTLVSSAGNSSNYSSGGVTANYVPQIDLTGNLFNSESSSDLAINGRGFFTVNTKPDGTGSTYYTRAGEFRTDEKGNYVNTAAFTLMGWSLDNEGRLPGDPGNLDTTPNSLLSSLKPVNLKNVTGSASATTTVDLGLNLNVKTKILPGTGQSIKFDAADLANYNITSKDVIIPEFGATGTLNIGDMITIATSSPGLTTNFEYGGFAIGNNISAPEAPPIDAGIMGAATASADFAAATSGDRFTITFGGNSQSYTYKETGADTTNNEFNCLNDIRDIINATAGLTARIYNGQLYVAPTDANNALSVADVTGTFIAGTATKNGLFANSTNAPSLTLTTTGAGNRFATLDGLNALVNTTTGLTSTITNAESDPILTFNMNDPLGTLTVNAIPYNPAPPAIPPTNIATATTILTKLGLVSGVSGPAYEPLTTNMSSGKVNQSFSKNIQIFDTFGTGHNVQVSFVKIGINTWAVEIYAQTNSELFLGRADGQLANGILKFNGDGSLNSVSGGLSAPVKIKWANKALDSSITFDWGTAGPVAGSTGTVLGATDGIRQQDDDFIVNFADQNGLALGLITGTIFDKDGNVIAQFSNGTTRKIFRIPIADFANPNGLENRGGNAYAETTTSGSYNLKNAGIGGAGQVASSTLEQSNVEIADELTAIIKTQRNYQSNTKVIKASNDMLEDLNRIIG